MVDKLASLIELFLLNLLRKGYKFLFFLYFSQRVFHHPLLEGQTAFYRRGWCVLPLPLTYPIDPRILSIHSCPIEMSKTEIGWRIDSFF